MHYKCHNCHHRFETTCEMRTVGFCPACQKPLAGPLSGLLVDEFQIIAELGRGANGTVYLAWQLPLAREAALKLLPSDRVADPAAVHSFFSEARATARLCHPNIVQALQAGVTTDGVYYFAMELIDGRNIETILEQFGPPDYCETLTIAGKVATALDYAWRKEKMVHGDIKPANIILTHSGEPKLADLGLAQFGENRQFDMATPLYASPEVITSDTGRISFKADMYSFGATLYEMLCGEPPFFDTEPERVLEMHLEDVAVPLEKKLGFFDPKMSRFVERLLDKHPENRPTSWKIVAEFLLTRAITSEVNS